MVRLTHISLDPATYEQLIEYRKRHRVSMSRIVRSAVALWDGETFPPDPVRDYQLDGPCSTKARETKKVNKIMQRMSQ